MIRWNTNAIWLPLGMALLSTEGHTCSVIRIISNVEMVIAAETIVRATAVEYAQPPSNPNIWTPGVPDSRVRFKVIETVRGQSSPDVVLRGNLVSTDDFNDQPPPYTFVRPGGRDGSCFANSYRRGAQYLLFLKARGGELTVNWAALAPVNEQLRSAEDPWLAWVRQQADKSRNVSQH